MANNALFILNTAFHRVNVNLDNLLFYILFEYFQSLILLQSFIVISYKLL